MTSFNDSCRGTKLSPFFIRKLYLGLFPGQSLLEISIGGGGVSKDRLHTLTCKMIEEHTHTHRHTEYVRKKSETEPPPTVVRY